MRAAVCQIIPFSREKVLKHDQVLNLLNAAEELTEMAWLPGLTRCLLPLLLFFFFFFFNSINFFLLMLLASVLHLSVSFFLGKMT